MVEPIRIFIGYDRRVPIVYQVATHSILRRSSRPLSFTPLNLHNLRAAGLATRRLAANQSTEFSFSRFLTPFLAGYEGWVIFLDNDVVVMADIAELYNLRDESYAVMCIKHDHVPSSEIKFLGEKQTKYEKKNWSSVMLLNCAKCTALTPEYVDSASGLDLHRFRWLGDDSLIGDLPAEWNHLVETSEGRLEDQKLLHYTDGGPYYSAYHDCKWAHVWHEERENMLLATEQSLAEVFPEEIDRA